MKTEKQRQRDAASGVIGLVHEFDPSIGKIVAKGKINREIDPSIVITQLDNFREEMDKVKEAIVQQTEQLSKITDMSADPELSKFIDMSKKANAFLQRDGLVKSLEQRNKEYDVMKDDYAEQQALAEVYLEWKRKQTAK